MSDSANEASSDLDGLTGFFFYAFIVHPCVAWILRPGRFERKKSIFYAIAFLGGIAAIKTGMCEGDCVILRELKNRNESFSRYSMAFERVHSPRVSSP
jgi:hypothetical protein